MTYFAFTWYYEQYECSARGGWNDFKGARESLDAIKELILNTTEDDCDYQIVEADTPCVVEEGIVTNGILYSNAQAAKDHKAEEERRAKSIREQPQLAPMDTEQQLEFLQPWLRKAKEGKP
jgi:hypothetical protein